MGSRGVRPVTPKRMADSVSQVVCVALGRSSHAPIAESIVSW